MNKNSALKKFILFICIYGSQAGYASPSTELDQICKSELNPGIKFSTPVTKETLYLELEEFAAPILSQANLTDINPEYFRTNEVLVLKFLAQKSLSEVQQYLPVVCNKDWGITRLVKRESLLQTVSGAVFLAGFVTSLTIGAPAALPLMFASAGLGFAGYGFKVKRKHAETEIGHKMFQYDSKTIFNKRLKVFTEAALGMTFTGLILASNGFIQPQAIPVDKAKFAGETIRGWKLLVPNFKTANGIINFITSFGVRTFTTAEKMAEIEGDFWNQPAFWTDTVFNYFLALLVGNLGEAYKSSEITKLYSQVFFNSAAMIVIENWASHSQQLFGIKANERYRDFMLQFIIGFSWATRLPFMPIYNNLGKHSNKLVKIGGTQAMRLLVELPKNSILSAAMARSVIDGQSFKDAWMNSKVSDLLPFRMKNNRSPLTSNGAMELLEEWK